MFSILIIFLSILIPSIQSLTPILKLTFLPDEKYFTIGNQVEIVCEILNPNEDIVGLAQLWYKDYKTGGLIAIRRSLLNSPADDAPEIFKNNRNRRLEFVKKNHLRIRQLYLEDSGQYQCNCPDCEELLQEQTRDLQVMKFVGPTWHIGSGWPMQEHTKTIIKCTAEDFYPYVSHKIVHGHRLITADGKSVIPHNNIYPQKFSWEAIATPTADWHNTTLLCIVTQGNVEQHTIKKLEVLFTPRFLICDTKQHVNSAEEKATIECSYSGNPAPKITWLRQTDEKPIVSDAGITIETKDEHHGKYKSIVTFEREKLVSIPLKTSTILSNEPANITSSTKVIGENYYQQLLNGGFIVKLMHNNEVKGSQKINIISHINQTQSKLLDNSVMTTIQELLLSITIFSFLSISYMI